jgi:hypothetical protein
MNLVPTLDVISKNKQFKYVEYITACIKPDYVTMWGVWWSSWLSHCATSWKVVGSIPDGVTGIFHWPNPSGCTMALRLTQALRPRTDLSILPQRNRESQVQKVLL